MSNAGEAIPETARVVALLTHFLDRHAGSPEARALRRTKSRERRLLWLGRGFGQLVVRYANLRVRGLAEHLRGRKRFLRAHAERFLQTGGEQVVILGAGLDGLGERLALVFPDAHILEIDRAAVLATKAGAPVSRLAADLAAGFPEDHGLATDAPTLVVAEGLFMYLPREAVARLLHEAATAFRGPLELLATFADRAGAGSIDRIDAHLRRRTGSGFAFRCGLDEAAALIAEHGFDEVVDPWRGAEVGEFAIHAVRRV